MDAAYTKKMTSNKHLSKNNYFLHLIEPTYVTLICSMDKGYSNIKQLLHKQLKKKKRDIETFS